MLQLQGILTSTTPFSIGLLSDHNAAGKMHFDNFLLKWVHCFKKAIEIKFETCFSLIRTMLCRRHSGITIHAQTMSLSRVQGDHLL